MNNCQHLVIFRGLGIGCKVRMNKESGKFSPAPCMADKQARIYTEQAQCEDYKPLMAGDSGRGSK